MKGVDMSDKKDVKLNEGGCKPPPQNEMRPVKPPPPPPPAPKKDK
jgi:hypothetical protein